MALGLDRAAPLACLLTVVEDLAGHPLVVTALPDGFAGEAEGYDRRNRRMGLLLARRQNVQPYAPWKGAPRQR